MKYFFLFLFAISIYGQSPSKSVTVTSSNAKPAEIKSEKETKSTETSSLDDEELDKVFYTYYYLNLPKHLQKEDKDKKKLNLNLIRVFKKEIAKRDRSVTKEILEGMSSTTIKFKRVLEDSKWMKKIKTELRYIHFTEFMYIVRYKTYLTLILFQLDPELHLQSPSQVEFINVKEAVPSQELE